ncbi:MAG: hypothetical protein ACI82F_003632 [Planctomycetota bacterium]|jgi:hypothetical protein
MSIETTQSRPRRISFTGSGQAGWTATIMWKQLSSILFLCAAVPLILIGLTIILPDMGFGSLGFHGHRRASADRNSAIATLRVLAQVEAQALELLVRDSDMDGVGEYATIAELAGATEIRTTCGLGNARLDVPLLSPSFRGLTEAGCSPRQGYLFRVFLAAERVEDRIPGLPNSPDGGFPRGGPFPGADNGEKHWCALAWPIDRNSLSTQAFFLDERGVLLETENADLRYAGDFAGPDFDAALSSTQPGDMRSPLAINGTLSNDGRNWTVVGR